MGWGNFKPLHPAILDRGSLLAARAKRLWLFNEGTDGETQNAVDLVAGQGLEFRLGSLWDVDEPGLVAISTGGDSVDDVSGGVGPVTLTPPFSLFFTFLARSTGTFDTLVAESGSQSLYLHSGQLHYYVGSGIITGTTTVSVNTWYTAGLVVTPLATEFFLNGLSDGTDGGENTDFTLNYLFTSNGGGGEGFPGSIGQLIAFDDEVTAAEFASLHAFPYQMVLGPEPTYLLGGGGAPAAGAFTEHYYHRLLAGA